MNGLDWRRPPNHVLTRSHWNLPEQKTSIETDEFVRKLNKIRVWRWSPVIITWHLLGFGLSLWFLLCGPPNNTG